MKKILLFAVALALPLLFSCKKDNKDAGSASIPSGASFNTAATYIANNIWASFNGDNTFLAGTTPLKSLSWPENALYWGTYTYEEGTYTMFDDNDHKIGTLKVNGDNTVTLTINETPTTMDVTVTAPAAGDDNQRAASHTWKPESITIVYKSAAYNQTDGVDLNKFEEWAKTSTPVFANNMLMTKVIVSNALVVFVFKNGQTFAAKIPSGASFANFSMTQLTVKGTEDLPIFQGTASISFSNGKCLISVNGQYEGESASAVLTLSL